MRKIIFLIVAGTALTTLLVVIGIRQNQQTAEVPVDPSVKKILQLSLTDSLVGKMEKDWKNLPRQAEAKREERGWRLMKIKKDSLFAQAGFQEGDLITTEFLNAARTSNSEMRLMLRVQQILNQITR